ncbi:putative quinol monooxygenase [Micromonospora sp. SCSIO 07396]
MTDRALVVAGFACARVGRIEELKARMVELARLTIDEPGCLDYRVHQDPEQPRNLFFYEAWRSAEDLDRHLGQEHLSGFMAELPGLVDGDIDVRQFRLEQPQPL